MKKISTLMLMATAASIACSFEQGEEFVRDKKQEANVVLDARRSLAVTEQTILAGFSLERVMDQLVAQSGVPGLTATQLFQQWWDTQNPGPGVYGTVHCDDTLDPVRGPLLNDFPYMCRPAPSEGAQVSCDPFAASGACAYVPIGLFNRFDLAPEDGSHCGEYRIIYAKESGILANDDRNLFIFEAVMPNPQPHLGLKGCQNIVKTWSKLSSEADLGKRADDLEEFYFDGHGQIPPVVHIDHYGAGGSGRGQIRTNQFILASSSTGNTGWMLREFKLALNCGPSSCSSLEFIPVTSKTNAAGELFDPASTHAQASAFRADFPTRIESLLSTSVGGIGLTVLDSFNSGQSGSSGPSVGELDYITQLGPAPSALRSALEAELATQGSLITVDQLLERARTQTCAGCHRRSRNADLGQGLVWPADLGFVHVSERITETVGSEVRFEISDALKDEFLPARKVIMEDFLNDKPRPPVADPTQPIAGHQHHG